MILAVVKRDRGHGAVSSSYKYPQASPVSIIHTPLALALARVTQAALPEVEVVSASDLRGDGKHGVRNGLA